MDIEMIRMINKVIGGIDVSDETVALDVIDQVGAGGEFLTHEHTFRHMKGQSQPNLFDRNVRDVWVETDGGDIVEHAYEEARHILKNHKPLALPYGAAETMRSIVEEYEAEIEANQAY